MAARYYSGVNGGKARVFNCLNGIFSVYATRVPFARVASALRPSACWAFRRARLCCVCLDGVCATVQGEKKIPFRVRRGAQIRRRKYVSQCTHEGENTSNAWLQRVTIGRRSF